MEGNYEVLYGGKPVGKAEVLKQGLYYRISCRCRINDGEVCRLAASWPDGWKNLGIPVPEGDGFFLSKKIPVKHIGSEGLRFIMIPVNQDAQDYLFPHNRDTSEIAREESAGVDDHRTDPEEQNPDSAKQFSDGESAENDEDMVAVTEDTPFERLDELESARLDTQDGQTVVLFPSAEDTSDIQDEADGAMVGTQNIGIDGSGADLITDTV